MAHFVVSQHDATTLHFDLRLELDGVLKSWAVPKGPSLDPAVKRLAIEVSDHDLDAADFEGVHAGTRRGTGAVIIWDEGTFELRARRDDHLVVDLDGHKLRGGFALTRTSATQWILVKMRDADAEPGSDVVARAPLSVRSGRTWQQVAAQSDS